MRQPNTSAQRAQDCRHSPEPFHALFRAIAIRPDVSAGAKLLYGALVSQHRLCQRLTQAEIGESIGASRHQVWRWTAELVRTGLLLVKRIGLTQPNLYTLLGVDADSLDGRASGRRPAAPPEAGRSGAGRHDTSLREEPIRRMTYGRNYHGFAGVHLPGGP